MTEAEFDRITLTFMFLMALSTHHLYFGRDIPKWSWRLAIVLSIVAGMYIGFVMASFPSNLIIGTTATLVILFFNGLVRYTRNRQETFRFKDE